MKQIGLIPSGCQIVSTNILFATDKYLFYGSSVAIYILNSKTFIVEKILNVTDKHLTCFSVSVNTNNNNNKLISIGTDGKILLWNIEEVNELINI